MLIEDTSEPVGLVVHLQLQAAVNICRTPSRPNQNRTSTATSVGRRCRAPGDRGTHKLLLVRETKANTWDGTQTYTCLGPAAGLFPTRSKLMAIPHRLRHRMTVEIFRRACRLG